jgi:uncharacterized membrane protein
MDAATGAGTRAEHPVVTKMRTHRANDLQLRLADAITRFAGSMNFVYLHVVAFAVWMVVVERSPWPTLTLVVSLEAIFLSTFVMVSQNRQAARENVRADLDFETNVRSEVWSIHMGRALGVDPEEVERRVQELLAENRARMSGSAEPPE